MKLILQNLGRIKQAELELRPLTVLMGKNGTGKTWAAHSYFKLLEQFRVEQRSKDLEASAAVASLTHQIADDWKHLIDASTAGSTSFSAKRDDFIDRLPDEVSLSLQGSSWPSTLGARLPRTTLAELRITRDELRRGEAERIEVTVGKEPLHVQKSIMLASEPEPRVEIVYLKPDELRGVLRGVAEDLILGWRKHVRALPAERVNLGHIFPTLLQNRDTPMPRALVDFCYMMSLAASTPSTTQEGVLLEQIAKLAGGSLEFSNREIVFRPSGVSGVVLPLKATASLVKSVAGLHVFLSVATRGDVLIIDEPEMNAHPETQVLLAEIFVAAVRQGIEIVLATHSPYIVDRLSTLVEVGRLNAEARHRLRDALALGSDDVYLLPEELAVYQFEPEGIVNSVFDREKRTIDWSTFTAVTERESRVINAVLEAEEHGADV